VLIIFTFSNYGFSVRDHFLNADLADQADKNPDLISDPPKSAESARSAFKKTALSSNLRKTCTPYFLLFRFGCNTILVQAKWQGKAVNFEQAPEQPDLRTPRLSQKHTNRLTIIGIVLTVAGIGLFAYFVYSVGVGEIVNNISRFGIDGFGIILALLLSSNLHAVRRRGR
jgi:hypothetical protein